MKRLNFAFSRTAEQKGQIFSAKDLLKVRLCRRENPVRVALGRFRKLGALSCKGYPVINQPKAYKRTRDPDPHPGVKDVAMPRWFEGLHSV